MISSNAKHLACKQWCNKLYIHPMCSMFSWIKGSTQETSVEVIDVQSHWYQSTNLELSGLSSAGTSYSSNQVLGMFCKKVGNNKTSNSCSSTALSGTAEPKISSTLAQHEKTQLSKEAHKDLTWWSSQLPSKLLCTIAEVPCNNIGCINTEQWTRPNVTAMKAAFIGIQSFLKEQLVLRILFRLDNRTVIAYLNKMESSSLTPLYQTCYSDMGLVPSPENNFKGGIPSYTTVQQCPSMFNTLNHQLGPFSIDLFASRTNHQLPTQVHAQ